MSFALACQIFLCPSIAWGQEKPNVSREQVEHTLRTKKQDLDSSRLREKKLNTDVVFLERERARINQKLVSTADLVKETESRLTKLEERLEELGEQEKLVRGSLSRQHKTLTKLLAAMQRMGRNPPPVVVTRREDALAMVRSAMMLASVFPELRGKAIALGEKLNELVRIMTATREKRDNLLLETKRFVDTRRKLNILVAEKQNTLSVRQTELAEIRREAKVLSRNVTDLNVLIAKLDEVVARKSKLGEYQRQIAALKPAIEPNITPPSIDQSNKMAKEISPSTKGNKPAVELVPSSKRVAMLSPGRMKPRIRFSRAKKTLAMPASGRQILGYGDETSFGTKSKGLAIATRSTAQITSPSDGWVVFAGPFRSYGQLLIINGGEDYHVLLAGLSQIDVSLGQFVIRGEPVGVMGKSAKPNQPNSGQGTNPVLYVEFRKRGQPINPSPWWSQKSKKVQG